MKYIELTVLIILLGVSTYTACFWITKGRYPLVALVFSAVVVGCTLWGVFTTKAEAQ